MHSDHRKLILMPIGWETHASPEYGERPQAIINWQILAGCDLLVAAFRTRLGTPTGKYPSGKVEEIKEHAKAGKPVMLYFSSVPVHHNVIYDKQLLKQYEDLRRFETDCRKEGLIEKYDSLDDSERNSLASSHKESTSYCRGSPLQSMLSRRLLPPAKK